MDKVTKGIIGGAVVSALSIYALNDRRMRNKVAKDSKKMLKKTGNLLDKMDIF